MNNQTFIANYVSSMDTNKVELLNTQLTYAFKAIKRPNFSVRAEVEQYFATHEGVGSSSSSVQMSLGAAIAIANYFGTRGAADAAINAHNAPLKNKCYSVRGLKDALVGKDAKGPKDSVGVKAANAVKPMTDAQWKAFVKAENKRRGL